jgi:hypothetical protein
MTLSTIIASSHDAINSLRARMKHAKAYRIPAMQARIDTHLLYLAKLKMLQERK